MMKNKKGFTLIEVLVALMLVAVAIFAFTPIIVHSFQLISVSGESRSEIFDQREDIEQKIAGNSSDGTDRVEIIFQNGSDIFSSNAEGKVVSDSGDNIFAFITNTKGEAVSLTLKSRTPGYTNKFSEDSWAKIVDRTVDITTDSELFDDETKFVMTNNNGDIITVNGGFNIDSATSAHFVLPETPLPAVNSPYKVSYGDAYAYLFVNLTNFEGVEVLATANANRLIFSEAMAGMEPDEIKFYDGGQLSSTEANISLNDVVWVPDTTSEDAGKFVLVGNNGYYAEIGNTVVQGGDFNEVNMKDKTLLYNLTDFTDNKTGVIKNISDIFSVTSTGAGNTPLFAGQFGLAVYEKYHENTAFDKNINGCTYEYSPLLLTYECDLSVGGSPDLNTHYFLYKTGWFGIITEYKWVTKAEYDQNKVLYSDYKINEHQCKGMSACTCGIVDAQEIHSEKADESETYYINSVFGLASNTIQTKYDIAYDGAYNFVHVTNEQCGDYRRTIAADAENNVFIYWDAEDGVRRTVKINNATPIASAIGYHDNWFLGSDPIMGLLTTTGVSFVRGTDSTSFKKYDIVSGEKTSIAFADYSDNNNVWVVVGKAGLLYQIKIDSRSNVTGSRIKKYIDTADGKEKNIPTTFNFNRVVNVNDRLFAVGDNGLILSSGDGATWYRHYIYKMVNDEITDEIVTDINITSIAGR